MSWLFSRALVEEFSAGTSLAGELSAPSSGNPTPQAFCAPDKTMAFSRLSRFGMTFRPLTEDRGEELLTLYRAAFPARTYQLQEKAQALTENGQECGSTWRGWLAKYDPVSCSWRTAQCSLLEDLNESLATLPRSGMTRDGLLWEQPMWERRTKETGSGSWATPQHRDFRSGQASRWDNPKRSRNLNDQVAKWPTPTANQFDVGDVQTLLDRRERVKAQTGNGNGFGLTLAQAVKVQMWPTPQASDNRPRATANSTARRMALGKQISLEAAVKFWPTPKARDWKDGRSEGTASRQSPDFGKVVGQSMEAGSLNPNWVEWLMGWPLGWTDLKPLATAKSLNVPQPHGDCLPLEALA